MALSEQQRQTVKDLKAKGYTEAQVLSFFGANEMGRSNSSIHEAEKKEVLANNEQQRQAAKPSFSANTITDALGLGGATDTFGKLISRSGVLPQNEGQKQVSELTGMSQKEINQNNIEAPTGKQIVGAVAQTASIPAGIAVTGGTSLAGQMAVGAGLGYLYDVGGDFAEGKTGASNFTPGVETLVGAAIPPVLKGAGSLIRGAGTLLSRTKPVAPVSNAVGKIAESTTNVVSDTASDLMTPLRQTAKEYAINRPSRLFQRAGDAIQESKDMAKVYETAPAPVRNAIDANLDMRVINAVSEADPATKAGYKKIVQIAEEGSDKLGVKARPEIVAGNAAADQYGILNAKRQEVGSKIGDALDNLPKETYQTQALYQEVDNLLKNNGITPTYSNTGVKLDFTGSNIPPKQRTTIQALYDLLTETGNSITPRQLYNKDRLLSQLQREARFDGVSDIMIKTPEGNDVDMFKALREVFTSELEAVAPSIRPLNKEYAQLRGLQDDIESTIFKKGNYQGTRDVDPAEFAQTNLRRVFSDATSAADYKQIYNNLDAYSRALGYEGARADDLAAFAIEMRKLYPDSVPSTSATSIFGGVADKVMSAINMGKANLTDQQRALRGLLDISEKYTPTKKAGELFTKKSLSQRTKEALKDQRGAINPGPLKKDNPFVSYNYNTLSPKGEQLVNKFLAHMDGTKKLSASEWKDVQADMLTLANEAKFNSKGGSNNAIAKEAADRYQKSVADWGNLND